jgi:L-ascorbate metabolism protein UlaG (beta-lactamase superfamily)
MTAKPRITFLGQSGFHIETPDSSLLIDPSNKKSGDLEGDIVYCTHKHWDHVGGVKTFMERNPEAILLGNEQVTKKFTQYGARVVTCNEDESYQHGPWSFEFKKLKHGVFRGALNLAVVARTGEFSFAHCGDAAVFEGFPSSAVDLLAVPISGGFAAGPGRALELVQSLSKPLPTIVPMHWLLRNPKSFFKKVTEAVPGVDCVIPTKGERLRGFE